MDRRRIELVEPGVSAAPIHYESARLDVAATAALVAKVRASVVRATSAALDEIATALPARVVSISLRTWPLDFPEDIAVQRRVPYEARADAIMYRQVLSELAHDRNPSAGPPVRQADCSAGERSRAATGSSSSVASAACKRDRARCSRTRTVPGAIPMTAAISAGRSSSHTVSVSTSRSSAGSVANAARTCKLSVVGSSAGVALRSESASSAAR